MSENSPDSTRVGDRAPEGYDWAASMDGAADPPVNTSSRSTSGQMLSVSNARLKCGPIEPVSPSPTDSIPLDEIFSRLWRQRLILISITFAGIIVAALISLVRPPLYRARTAIQLEGLDDRYRNLGDVIPFSAAAANIPNEAYLQNELKILQSDVLAKRVADRLGIKAPRTERSAFGGLANLLHPGLQPVSANELRIKTVQRALTVRSSLKSQVVEISFDSPSRVTAASGANAVVSEYIALNREARLQTVQDTTAWLTTQIVDLKAKLDLKNAELQAFSRSAGLLYAADQSSLTEQRVRKTEEQLSNVRADRIAKGSRYQTAISNSPESLPNEADSGLLREHEGSLVTLQRELAQLRILYTPNHYKVLEVKARIAQLESAIQDDRRQIIQRMHAEFESSERLERALASTYSQQIRELEKQNTDAFRYNVMKRELDNTQQLYNSLLQKAKEAGIASALHATSVRVIDEASPPAAPYSPNLPLNCALGLSGGLFSGVALVLVRERGVRSIRQHDDPRILNIPALGTIPSVKHRSAVQTGTSIFTNSDVRAEVDRPTHALGASVLTESFRATVASMLFSSGVKTRHSIAAVTSVDPLEGKTTASTNVGIALTEAHSRVLLIDADLRRPRLHKVFKVPNDEGLTSVLRGEGLISDLRLDTLVHPTSVCGLFVLPSGPPTGNVTSLLYSPRMSELAALVRKEFDYVLIDTPPMTLFSDARIIGRVSDFVILVVHAGKADRRELNTACRHFARDGTTVLGAILNHWDVSRRRRTSYMRYTYREVKSSPVGDPVDSHG